MDPWRGIGDIVGGMHRGGWDLQLTEYGNSHWRATFWVTGFAHSISGESAYARTGHPRTVPLLALFDGRSVILIASRGGHAKHSSWYHNLRAHPVATTMVLGRKTQYRAREADGATRERLWRQAVELYPGYADYQARVARRVPVMILEPVAPEESQRRAL